MNRNRKVVLWALVAVLAAMAIAALFERRVLELAWARRSAKQSLERLSPQVRQNLNVIPDEIDLPALNLDHDRIQVVEVGQFAIQVLQPDSLAEEQKTVLLRYPHYQARILPPHDIARENATAKQVGFKDMFGLESAVYHTRLDDLDRQRDLPSLKRYLMLITGKVSNTYVREQFRCNGLRGFVFNPVPGTKRTVVEIYDSTHQISFGVWITDEGGQSNVDVHRFLQVLRVAPKEKSPDIRGTLPTSRDTFRVPDKAFPANRIL